MTTIEQAMPKGELKRPRGYAQGNPYWPAAVRAQRVMEFDVEVPFDLARARRLGADIPNELGAVMNALNLAVGLLAAHERLGEQDVQAWLDLGQNTFLAVDATVALHEGVRLAQGRPLGSAWIGLGKALGGTANLVDGFRNLAAGYEMLIGDDSPIERELAQGHNFRAWVLRSKGVAQLGAGAAGVVTGAGQLAVFAGAAATGFVGFATGGVGIAVAFCGLAIAGFDLTLAATSNFGEYVTTIEEAWAAARKKELPDPALQPTTAARLRKMCQLASAYA
jgi:hypothetical protein